MVGDGPERISLERLTSGLGLEDRIILVGHRDDARDWLAGCDVYVNSSISARACRRQSSRRWPQACPSSPLALVELLRFWTGPAGAWCPLAILARSLAHCSTFRGGQSFALSSGRRHVDESWNTFPWTAWFASIWTCTGVSFEVSERGIPGGLH
jgi:hypothetical protein